MGNKLDLQHSNLEELLNDESFIRWLRDEATRQEEQKWDRWLADDPENRMTVRKAKKIITMPFIEDIPSDTKEELRILIEQIEEFDP